MKHQTESHFLNELFFYVEAEVEGQYFVNYKIYEVTGMTMDDIPKPLFGYNFSESLEDVEALCEGSVKWDGCSDWGFIDNFHECTREDLKRISDVLLWCWDKTGELIPDKWDPQ